MTDNHTDTPRPTGPLPSPYHDAVCREMTSALEHINRAWGAAGEIAPSLGEHEDKGTRGTLTFCDGRLFVEIRRCTKQEIEQYERDRKACGDQNQFNP